PSVAAACGPGLPLAIVDEVRPAHMSGQAPIHVREATRQDLIAWQDFVDRAPDAGCLHHAGWYEVLRDAFWVTPHFLMATDATDQVIGILPLYYSRSPLTGAHVSSLEDGVLATAPEAAEALLQRARTLRDSLRARYLQIRGGAIDMPATFTIP